MSRKEAGYAKSMETPASECEEMGRVTTAVTIENLEDVWAANRGLCALEDVRRVEVVDALVDTGGTLLALPTRLIRQLGLSKKSTKRVKSTTGGCEVDVYGTVRLTIQGRECPTDAMEVPDDVPVLIGQIPLEYLDFVVEPRNQRLIGNPEHGGEHVLELY
jgi:predicted aspartyl protease